MEKKQKKTSQRFAPALLTANPRTLADVVVAMSETNPLAQTVRAPIWCGLREYGARRKEKLVSLRAYQRKKLIACLFIVPERPQHRAGHCLPVLLFHSAHLHAQMPRLDDHAHAFRTDLALNRFRNLAGHALLNLQPTRKHIHQARNLA